MLINHKNNFCRVFVMPKRFPSDFCFGAGIPVTFAMVDWFNPYPAINFKSFGIPNEVMQVDLWKDLPSLYESKNGEVDLNSEQRDKLNSLLSTFIKRKNYYNSEYDYLVITSYGDSFIVKGDRNED